VRTSRKVDVSVNKAAGPVHCSERPPAQRTRAYDSIARPTPLQRVCHLFLCQPVETPNVTQRALSPVRKILPLSCWLQFSSISCNATSCNDITAATSIALSSSSSPSFAIWSSLNARRRMARLAQRVLVSLTQIPDRVASRSQYIMCLQRKDEGAEGAVGSNGDRRQRKVRKAPKIKAASAMFV
jgi:hypothetical protein